MATDCMQLTLNRDSFKKWIIRSCLDCFRWLITWSHFQTDLFMFIYALKPFRPLFLLNMDDGALTSVWSMFQKGSSEKQIQYASHGLKYTVHLWCDPVLSWEGSFDLKANCILWHKKKWFEVLRDRIFHGSIHLLKTMHVFNVCFPLIQKGSM